MPVNFFDSACQELTKKISFGICDDPPPSKEKAYINDDINSKADWIAEITNNTSCEILFIAIDNCVVIKRDNGDLEKRCDCMLTYRNVIIFLELKDRAGSGWLSKAKDQIISTIKSFKANHSMDDYRSKRVYIANAQRPLYTTNYQKIIEEIRIETGFITEVKRVIDLT